MSGVALFVISGVSAAGKSTAARLLAARFPRGICVGGDAIRAMIVSGRLEMTPGAGQQALAQLRLRYAAGLAADRHARRNASAYNGGRFTIGGLQRILREETDRIGLWLDSTRLTPGQTVDQILADPAASLIRTPQRHSPHTGAAADAPAIPHQ